MTASRISSFVELTKPRLTALAVMATMVGFVMASGRPCAWSTLLITVIGAAFVGGGGNAMNEWYERDADARMRRTQMRPLPTKRLTPLEAEWFAIILSLVGVAVLWLAHPLAAWLGVVTWISYVAIYTPLKRVTALCTLVGAVPGALPPLIGWAAARGEISLGGVVLFAILFLWQLPHFLAIAWMYQDDYARAGFRMLPLIDFGQDSTARQVVLYSIALLPASLVPTMIGLSGSRYFYATLIIGLWFIKTAVVAAWRRSPASARQLFLGSIGYLPIVLSAMVLDRGLW